MTTALNAQSKVVNANENNRLSWWDNDENSEFVPHIPFANLLIRKHCKSWWKNQPEKADYQYNQLGICLQMDMPRSSREWKLRFLALHLECNPIELMNDPSPELKNINS